MDFTRFGVQLIAPLPTFGALPRDRLMVRVGHPRPIVLYRVLPPNYGAIVEALDDGRAFALRGPDVQPEAAAEIIRLLAAGDDWRPPHPHQSPPRPAHPPGLRLLRPL